MDDYKIEHQRAKQLGMIPARFVMRDGKQYYLTTGLPVRTISGTDEVCIHGYPADEPCDGE